MLNLTREQAQRIVFILYIVLLVYKGFNAELLFQHTNPPLNYPILNFPYWLFLLSGLKNYIFEHTFIKFAITVILFLSAALSSIKSSANFYPKIFCVTLWIYQFLYFSIVAYQPFAIGLLFPCIPFIFSENLKFWIAFNFGRYFFCGLYFLSGILKIVNGGVFNIYQLTDSIRMSSVDYMLYNSNNFKTDIMSFFVQHYIVGYFLYLGATILEIAFFIGFLMKRFDFILAGLFLIFHFSNYALLDLPFTNHIIILVFLVPLRNYLTENESTVVYSK